MNELFYEKLYDYPSLYAYLSEADTESAKGYAQKTVVTNIKNTETSLNTWDSKFDKTTKKISDSMSHSMERILNWYVITKNGSEEEKRRRAKARDDFNKRKIAASIWLPEDLRNLYAEVLDVIQSYPIDMNDILKRLKEALQLAMTTGNTDELVEIVNDIKELNGVVNDVKKTVVEFDFKFIDELIKPEDNDDITVVDESSITMYPQVNILPSKVDGIVDVDSKDIISDTKKAISSVDKLKTCSDYITDALDDLTDNVEEDLIYNASGIATALNNVATNFIKSTTLFSTLITKFCDKVDGK